MDLREIYKTDHGDIAGMDILLLEVEGGDEGRFRKLLAECDPGYNVSYAGDIDEALDMLRTGYVELLIFDLSSIGIDSLEDLIDPAIDLKKPYAVIAIVDEKDESLGVDAAKRGAEDYLIKEKTDAMLLGRSIRQSMKCHHLRHRNINLILVDRITGLLARKGFMMMAEQQLKLAQRYKTKTFLLFLEVEGLARRKAKMDKVKYENALRATSSILRHTFRGADILGLIGDGAFGGLPVGAPVESSSIIYERLKDEVGKFRAGKSLDFDLEFNKEIVMFDPSEPQSIEDMIGEAEGLLAEQKRRRNG